MPRPPPTLTFDRLTLRLVCESHLRWGTFLPNFGVLGFCVLELFAVYTTDGRTDGQTDSSNAYCPFPYGWEHNKMLPSESCCILVTFNIKYYNFTIVWDTAMLRCVCMLIQRLSVHMMNEVKILKSVHHVSIKHCFCEDLRLKFVFCACVGMLLATF